MNDARAVVGMDRLPWLTDEPKPRLPRARGGSGARELLGWAVAGLLFVAGLSYWLGLETGRSGEGESVTSAAEQRGSTVKLPEPRAIAPEVPIAAAPVVRPVPSPTVSARRARVEKPVQRRRTVRTKRRLSPIDLEKGELSRTVARQRAERAQAAKPVVSAWPRPLASRSQLRLWPSTQSRGAYGRVVRIGAFGTRQQAKLGWRRMQRAYPAIGRLPAAVVTDRNSRGRRFYRFQIGTTSQAHSEVLCQRMARIRFSCAVVGLPWKSKIER